jgi:hypothetical protein
MRSWPSVGHSAMSPSSAPSGSLPSNTTAQVLLPPPLPLKLLATGGPLFWPGCHVSLPAAQAEEGWRLAQAGVSQGPSPEASPTTWELAGPEALNALQL